MPDGVIFGACVSASIFVAQVLFKDSYELIFI